MEYYITLSSYLQRKGQKLHTQMYAVPISDAMNTKSSLFSALKSSLLSSSYKVVIVVAKSLFFRFAETAQIRSMPIECTLCYGIYINSYVKLTQIVAYTHYITFTLCFATC